MYILLITHISKKAGWKQIDFYFAWETFIRLLLIIFVYPLHLLASLW